MSIKLCLIELHAFNGLTCIISHSTEIAMQNVAMFLRSVPNWEIVESLPDIGKYIYFLYNVNWTLPK